MRRIFAILTLLLISCSATYEEFTGGRYGHSFVTIKLYADSTYSYSEWVHTGLSIDDKGKWTNQNGRFYLQSSSRTRWTGIVYKSAKTYLFNMQEFTIDGNTLQLIPKDTTKSDYYYTYYNLVKTIKTNNK